METFLGTPHNCLGFQFVPIENHHIKLENLSNSWHFVEGGSEGVPKMRNPALESPGLEMIDFMKRSIKNIEGF